MTTHGIKVQNDVAMKAILHRIAAMLTRMAMKVGRVAGPSAEGDAEIGYICEPQSYRDRGLLRWTPDFFQRVGSQGRAGVLQHSLMNPVLLESVDFDPRFFMALVHRFSSCRGLADSTITTLLYLEHKPIMYMLD